MYSKVYALIPARYDSARLPGKPLLYIDGKTVIQRVYEQTCKSIIPKNYIFIVTDNDKIIEECKRIGAQYIKIDEYCENGTSRIAKAYAHIIESKGISSDHGTLILNVQGDEPFINPEHINYLIQQAQLHKYDDDVACTTLHFKLETHQQIKDRNIGKIVLNNHNGVIYCSRAVIPHTKTGDIDPNHNYLGHVGIFGFKDWYLPVFCKQSPNHSIYKSEDIEWLKILEQSYKIQSYEIDCTEIGVNTPEDYTYLVNKYERGSRP